MNSFCYAFATMGGDFLFVVLECLIRKMLRVFRTRSVETWLEAKAEVTTSSCASGFACPVAEIYYTYVVDGEFYAGVYEKPFVLLTSAQDYVKRLPAGLELKVRINPADPALSAVLDRDQTLPYTVDSHTL